MANEPKNQGLIESFAYTLTVERKFAKLSQEELAERIGVHRNTISRWESGDPSVSLENIEKLAKELNIHPARFLMQGLEFDLFDRMKRILDRQIDIAVSRALREGSKPKKK